MKPQYIDPFQQHLQGIIRAVETELESRLERDRSPEGLVNGAERCFQLADREISKVHHALEVATSKGQTKGLDCKPGCSWCCYRRVVATIPEALAIASFVQRGFSNEDRLALKSRAAEYVQRMALAKDDEKSRSREACPLLVDNLCSVYDVRPLACRGLNSTNVQTCIDIKNDPGGRHRRASLPAQDAIADAAVKGERTALFFEALDHRLVDLGLAISALLESDEPVEIYLSGSDELKSAKVSLAGDPLANPEVQRMAEPAFKGDREKNGPSGKPGRTQLASVAAFWHQFLDEGEFWPAMKSLGKGNAAQLVAQMQVPSAYESVEDIQRWREHVLAAQREFASSSVDPADAFDSLALHVPLRMAYQGLEDNELIREHSEMLFEKIGKKLFPDLVEPIDRRPAKGRRIRVGYLSQNICNHNGARWAHGWLKNHAEDIERYVFNVGFGEDAVSMDFKADADHYFFLARSVPENARFIKSQELDVLILTDAQATGRNTQYSLFRMAPVQCAAWGNPVTTGLPTVDYYLSSEKMEPPGAQEQYTEQLVLLPNSGLCYPRITSPIPNVSRSHFGIPEDRPFLYLAQAKMKCLPQYDVLYKEISERLDAPIVLHESQPAATNVVKRRMERAGVRTHWLPFVSRGEFLRLMQLCDVSLDTPMWSGGNTAVEALTFGKPLITLPGPTMRSRHSYAFVNIANASGLVAKDMQDYVALATDQERQQAALKDLDIDALYEDKACIQALDDFLRSL